MIGAILMKTVPAITIRSASRGVPRITSAPNRAMSYLLVMLVAISTKQQERPKLNGQMEFFRPQASRSCSRARMRLRRTASSNDPPASAWLRSFRSAVIVFGFHWPFYILQLSLRSSPPDVRTHFHSGLIYSSSNYSCSWSFPHENGGQEDKSYFPVLHIPVHSDANQLGAGQSAGHSFLCSPNPVFPPAMRKPER